MPRVRLENLMRFSKVKTHTHTQKKWVTESVFKLFLKTKFQSLFVALYRCHCNRWDIADTLKKLHANRLIQMTKHRSCDRDTSVVIFLHWTRTVSRGKSYRASLRSVETNSKSRFYGRITQAKRSYYQRNWNLTFEKLLKSILQGFLPAIAADWQLVGLTKI